MTEIKFKKLSKEDIKALSNDSLSTEVRLEEAVKKSITFPHKMTYRMVCQNIPEAQAKIDDMLKEKFKLDSKISTGNLSKSGKYVTLMVETKVPDFETFKAIYEEAKKLPFMMHVL
ncbi:MAG: DUF493 family protein [Succinivibrionaceae bacterium]|nr:DUF493 family protein [Succinivibrionaceae bacterium]